MPRRPLPQWMQDPSPLEARLLRARVDDRALVRRSRLTEPEATHGEPEVLPVYVQRTPDGILCTLALRGVAFAEFDPRSDYEGNGEFVCEDYLLTLFGFLDEHEDEERLRREAAARTGAEIRRTNAEARAIMDAVTQTLGPVQFGQGPAIPARPDPSASRVDRLNRRLGLGSNTPRRPVVERTNRGAPGRPTYQVNDPAAFQRRIATLSRIKQLRFAGLHEEANRLLEQLREQERPK